ncbi:hypothetical protein [Segetibacter sp. 3557_3]|uniref:hypothetical protein n=1 Tax=Segetibacter sp. 3557_3 TaxID=2547429 RepID=UPI0014054D35|nr:hypothetical protein [Segetibacter sp. 3557_3]
MQFYLSVLFSATVIVACIIALNRYHLISRLYRPFVFILWLGFLVDLTGYITIMFGVSYAVPGNIYVLINLYLVLWLFTRWEISQSKKRLFQIMAVLLTLVWILDNFILNPITQLNVLFRFCYSSLLIFLSIDQINRVIVSERKNIWKNARFVICAAFLIFYTFKSLEEIFFLVIDPKNEDFLSYVWMIMMVITLVVNSIYAYAALCIPSKEKFILPY